MHYEFNLVSSWTQNWYDTAATKRSNAYGWLNANGPGSPLFDPLGRTVAEVHVYLDEDAAGSTTAIVSVGIARERLAVAVDEAAAQGYKVFVGELGFFAGNPLAAAAWSDVADYLGQHPDVCTGMAWWAGGAPGWWDDVGADGGGHFSVTPTRSAAGLWVDTINMSMITAAPA